MESQIPHETELIERIGWLIRLRWFAILGTGSATALSWLLYPGALPLLPLVAVTAVIALYNTQFLLYRRTLELSPAGVARLRHARRFARIQILVDLVALATLLHFSGGVENPAAIFFVFHTIIASILLSRTTSFVMSTVAAFLFASVAALEAAGILQHYHLPVLGDVEPYRMTEYLLAATGTMALTLWLVAYMTSSIADRLRARDRELLESHQASLSKSRQLEALNERLRRIDAERTRFLTLVTHELRAPINTIHTNLELLLSGYLPPEKVDGLLKRLMQRTEELSDLVTDLLRLARAREEASRDEQLAAVQAAEVLENVVQLMKAEADSKDIFLSVDVAPDLAPVQAHPDRLKLVWTNVLSNAIKYTEAGGIITVALKQEPQSIVGTIRDTGIGIAPEDQAHIFEEFYRAENARSLSSVGTGVGLAIVKRLVENWGGEIQLESELGLGSKFTILLPRADIEVQEGS